MSQEGRRERVITLLEEFDWWSQEFRATYIARVWNSLLRWRFLKMEGLRGLTST